MDGTTPEVGTRYLPKLPLSNPIMDLTSRSPTPLLEERDGD